MLKCPKKWNPTMAAMWAFVAWIGTFPMTTSAQVAQNKPDLTNSAASDPQDLLVVSKELPLLRWMISRLPQAYIDPAQFDPPRMHRAALERLAYYVTDIWVDFSSESKGIFTLHVGSHRKDFAIGSFFGILDVWIKAQKIMPFIKEHYRGSVTAQQMDYYMVQGILSTLDKQTRLVDVSGQTNAKSLVQPGMIGILSDMKGGKLIIQKVYPDSPADQAGLLRGDQIVQINGEPVLPTLTLDQLVPKMRGFRGTRLALHLLRKGWKAPQRIVLIRAQMQAPLVVAHLLPGRIAYIRLRQFSQGATAMIREEMGRLRRKIEGNFLGLILDLRNNPGGLVIEAVAICSMFVEKGEVTSFVGARIPRKTYNVTGKNTEEKYPLVVLLNGRSASASELLAGALQMHNRAVILGRQSYGKGTVQSAGLALGGRFYMAVTIAQYLIPGDVSIQGAGIRPDIELVPVRINAKDPQYYRSMLNDIEERKLRWPKFLQQNLDLQRGGVRQLMFLQAEPTSALSPTSKTPDAAPSPKTSTQTTTPRQGKRAKKPTPRRAQKNKKRRPAASSKDDWHMPNEPEDLHEDFEVWFARYLLRSVNSGRRDVALQQAESAIERTKKREEKRIVAALRQFGIDWQASSKKRKPTRLQAEIHASPQHTEWKVGQPVHLRVTLRNLGETPAHRVHAVVYSDLKTFQHHELLLGRIAPKQTITKTWSFTLPTHYPTQPNLLRVEIEADNAEKIAPLYLKAPIQAPAYPSFRIVYQVLDHAPDGNQDGQLQPGEHARLRVSLQNIATSATSKKARLSLLIKGAIVLQPQQPLSNIGHNQQHTAEFSIKIPDAAPIGPLQAALHLHDPLSGYTMLHPITLQVAPASSTLPTPAKGWAVFSQKTPLWGQPADSPFPTFYAHPSTSLPVSVRFAGYLQVRLPNPPQQPTSTHNTSSLSSNQRPPFAWVREKDIRLQTSPSPQKPQIEPIYAIDPPRIDLPQQNSIWTALSSHTLSAHIHSQHGILDVYVLLKDKKVFYKHIQHPASKGPLQLPLRINLPLHIGLNHARIVVRTERGTFLRHTHLFRTSPPK